MVKTVKHEQYALDAKRSYAINARFLGMQRNHVIRFRKRCIKAGPIKLELISALNALFQ